MKRGSSAGLPEGILGMLVRFGRGDLGIFVTAAIGGLVVFKEWLWYARQVIGVYGGHAESSKEKVIWLHFLSCWAQIAVYALSAYWISGLINNISTYPAIVTPRCPTPGQPSKPSRNHSQKLDSSPSTLSGPASAYTTVHHTYTHTYPSTMSLTKPIDSCLESVTGFVSFTTAVMVYLYVHSVPPSFFENKAHVSALLVFAVWVGFRVSALCMIRLKSGTATIFTIFASRPVAFGRDFPAQYYKVSETSPVIGIEGV
ncbi:hypothetical protein HOY80DRAFT_1032130 [Tuber brumale]|nr:hypothetical protein HOY80DRAFT_1032130 [Tuber brumale]